MLSTCQDVDNIFVVIPVKNIMFKGAKVFHWLIKLCHRFEMVN